MQLKRTSLIKYANGFVLGAFVDCTPAAGKPSLSLPQVFRDTLGPMQVPVFGHLKYGHLPQLYTMPIGVKVRVEAKSGVVRFLEGAVR
jgi:muramoyltetrapeptide carboxypeptidase